MAGLTVTLQRTSDNGKRTRGILTVGSQTFYTLEEPWKDNRKGISCIPHGTYRVVPHGWEVDSKVKFKRSYRLLNTAPRVAILIHTGNTTDDIEGCILVGMAEGTLAKRDAVLRSVEAMNILRRLIGNNEFIIIIRGVDTPPAKVEDKPAAVPPSPPTLSWWQRLKRKMLS
jgi:hypothetical protein